MADGGHHGNRQVIMPYRRPRDGSELPAGQDELNTVHKRVRDRRRDRDRVHHATRGIALMHNLAMAG